MPRRKKDAGDAPAIPESKPEGMPEEVWTLGRKLGNVILAGNLIELRDGARAPENVGETVACLDAARKLETSALNRFVRLAQNAQLAQAEKEYKDARETTRRLTVLVTDPDAYVSRNGGTDDAPQQTNGSR